jgi:hypothetical protein
LKLPRLLDFLIAELLEAAKGVEVVGVVGVDLQELSSSCSDVLISETTLIAGSSDVTIP